MGISHKIYVGVIAKIKRPIIEISNVSYECSNNHKMNHKYQFCPICVQPGHNYIKQSKTKLNFYDLLEQNHLDEILSDIAYLNDDEDHFLLIDNINTEPKTTLDEDQPFIDLSTIDPSGYIENYKKKFEKILKIFETMECEAEIKFGIIQGWS